MAIVGTPTSAAAFANSDTSRACNVPNGVQPEDTLIATVACTGSTEPDILTPAGWTPRLAHWDASSTGVKVAWFTREVQGGDPSSYTFEWTGQAGVISIVARDDVDDVQPVVPGETALDNAESSKATFNLTMATSDARVIMGAFVNRSGYTWTADAGSERNSVARTSSTTMVVLDTAGPVPAGTHTLTATMSTASSAGVAAGLALNISGGGGGGGGGTTEVIHNTAAGGTPGALVTTSTQAGGSGTPFDQIYAGTGSEVRYSDQAPPGHTRSYAISQGTGNAVLVWKDTLAALGPITDPVVEFWLKLPANSPPVETVILGRAYDNANTDDLAYRDWEIVLDTRNRLGLRDKGYVQVITCATTLVPDTWFRVEAHVVSGTSASLKVSEGTDTVTWSQGSTTSFTATAVRGWRWGIGTGNTGLGTTYFGPLRIGSGDDYFTATIIGNEQPQSDPGQDQADLEPGTTVTLSGIASDPDGTVSTHNWSQLSGPAVTLNGSGPSRTYQAPATLTGDTLVFEYQVSDNGGRASVPGTVQHTVLPATESAVWDGVLCPVTLWTATP